MSARNLRRAWARFATCTAGGRLHSLGRYPRIRHAICGFKRISRDNRMRAEGIESTKEHVEPSPAGEELTMKSAFQCARIPCVFLEESGLQTSYLASNETTISCDEGFIHLLDFSPGAMRFTWICVKPKQKNLVRLD